MIENGFFYDFEFPKGLSFSVEDLPKVEAEMQKIVQADLPFQPRGRRAAEGQGACCTAKTSGSRTRSSTSWRARARRSVSHLPAGGFPDLCRGPHVPSTGKDQGVQAA